MKSHFDLPRLVALSIAVALAALLAGCGQTGPLYLPNKPNAAQTSSQPTPAPVKAPIDSQIPASN